MPQLVQGLFEISIFFAMIKKHHIFLFPLVSIELDACDTRIQSIICEERV